MTWIGQWLKNTVGSWFGSSEPEPAGAMRATLRGSSSVGATLTAKSEPEVIPGGGSAKGPQPLLAKNEDDVILAVVTAFILSQE